MRIAQGGKNWLLIQAIATLFFFVAATLSSNQLQATLSLVCLILLLLTILLLIFFRDPDRIIADGIVAAADGVIQHIQHIDDPDVGCCTKIVTFMNLHNVHIQRSPTDGTVKKIIHKPGGYLPAFTKDSERNERVITLLQTPQGDTIKIVQIAGTLARRIVTYKKEGDSLKKGERFGLIRLGSRVDVYLPDTMNLDLTVEERQRIKAGEDSLAQSHA